MTYAEIIGWGKCTPPAILTNDDLATVIDTSDEWIQSRTGMKKRHVSHVPLSEIAIVASQHALACAGISAEEIDLVVLGSVTVDEFVPNTATKVANAIGAGSAAAFDLNAACTGFIYALNVASDMIKAGSVRTALVIGAEKTTRLMDWGRRESCVLFGDGGGAVVLRASDKEAGLLSSSLSTVPGTREMLQLTDAGMDLERREMKEVYPTLNFAGQDIFKNAVKGMVRDCEKVLEKAGIGIDDVDLVIPHQANIRIIDAVGKRLGVPEEKVIVVVDEYANTSAGAIPLALCDALSQGRIRPGMLLLMPSFGAGLTSGAVLVRWGDRLTPVAESDAALPPCDQTALEILQFAMQAARDHYGKI